MKLSIKVALKSSLKTSAHVKYIATCEIFGIFESRRPIVRFSRHSLCCAHIRCACYSWSHSKSPDICNASNKFCHLNDLIWSDMSTVFTARRHASAVYAVVVCLSVWLSQVGVLLKRLSVGLRKQRYTIVQRLLVFWCQRPRQNSNVVVPKGGAKCRWSRLKLATFDQ